MSTPSPARRRSELSSADAQFVQLALDLHDGPLQDLAALGHFVGLLRDQLGTVGAEGEAAKRLLTLVDAVERGLASLDDDLRDLAWSMRSPTAFDQTFTDALRATLAQLQLETGIETHLELPEKLDNLPAAALATFRQIAHEALVNVAEHSGAREVRVRVEIRDDQARFEVVDNGCGFDVEAGLADAARQGRLGVVGMAERVRLVGGSFEIQSRVGGPTRVAAVLVVS